MEVAQDKEKRDITTSTPNFYANELAYFECKSVYFLVTIGYSWAVVFDNGTESADANIFVNGTGFRNWFFSLITRKLKFAPGLLTEYQLKLSLVKYYITLQIKLRKKVGRQKNNIIITQNLIT